MRKASKSTWEVPSTNISANLGSFLEDSVNNPAVPVYKGEEYTPASDDLSRKLHLVDKYHVLPEQNIVGQSDDIDEMDEAAAKAVSGQMTRERLSVRLERSMFDLEEMHKPKTFGERVSLLRKECGWSLELLAAKVDLSRDSVLDHINKGVMPRGETVALYAEAFTEHLGRPVTVSYLRGLTP